MFARRFYANSVSRFCFAASLMHAAEDNFMQGDHCSGKPVNVGEFDSRMGKCQWKLPIAYFKFGATAVIIRLL